MSKILSVKEVIKIGESNCIEFVNIGEELIIDFVDMREELNEEEKRRKEIEDCILEVMSCINKVSNLIIKFN
jgi:hypothetical protein